MPVDADYLGLKTNWFKEVRGAPAPLRHFVAKAVQVLLKDEDFLEALPGHLPGDPASQRRLPSLRTKLTQIAQLSA